MDGSDLAADVLGHCRISTQQITHKVRVFGQHNIFGPKTTACIFQMANLNKYDFISQILCKLFEKESRNVGWQTETVRSMVFGQLQIYQSITAPISTIKC